MARRGGEAVAKRARERARLAKRQAKQEKRQARANDASKLPATSEAALLQAFAQLSADYEANAVSQDDYNAERSRILTELGVQTD